MALAKKALAAGQVDFSTQTVVTHLKGWPEKTEQPVVGTSSVGTLTVMSIILMIVLKTNVMDSWRIGRSVAAFP